MKPEKQLKYDIAYLKIDIFLTLSHAAFKSFTRIILAKEIQTFILYPYGEILINSLFIELPTDSRNIFSRNTFLRKRILYMELILCSVIIQQLHLYNYTPGIVNSK